MRILIIFLLLILNNISAEAQNLQKAINTWAGSYSCPTAKVAKTKVDGITTDTDEKSLSIILSGGFQEQVFTPELIDSIYLQLQKVLPREYKDYQLQITTDGRNIEELVPPAMKRHGKNPRPLRVFSNIKPWVRNISSKANTSEGLQNTHISLWQSHGRYWNNSEWKWQRPRLYGTTEDILSQTFVVPYIIPMLENAGAIVFTPRDRDWQENEVIVDNDLSNNQGTYIETQVKKQKKNPVWSTSFMPGFANSKQQYESVDTPFVCGTARYAMTVTTAKEEAHAAWIPNVPESGFYAVYVTYPYTPNNTDEAHYQVRHSGGITEIAVNQQIGYGTWVYLGKFHFRSGENDQGMVILSNRTHTKGQVVVSDAIRLGGGKGNVTPTSFAGNIPLSGLPRWAEAAKYSTLWYGFPYSVHTAKFGNSSEYNNDINCRSAATNYLAGGSVFNPDTVGMKVPVELALAFHTDAGVNRQDSTVGSLAIYKTDFMNGKTAAGQDRYVSRDLAGMMLEGLRKDLRKYDWNIRQLWNRNYGEAREPVVPSIILEMLSHQNFEDMRLAYDPKFRFDLSRSVYKTIVRFNAVQHNKDYTIQPLPVHSFAINLNVQKGLATLSWEPQIDPDEPTAAPTEYIVYTRLGEEGGYDDGTVVRGTSYTPKLIPGVIYSFRVTAANKGGESFPSETLTAYIAPRSKQQVLILNAFTRLEGPAVINTSSECGFDIKSDPGVPYGLFCGFCGYQYSFDRSRIGDETSRGLGASGSELEGQLVMGNTFDYPILHATGLKMLGDVSFCSCSEEAFLNKAVVADAFSMVDVIYGTQRKINKQTSDMLNSYCKNGGKLLLSAANLYNTLDAPLQQSLLSCRKQTSVSDEVEGCGLSFSIHRTINKYSFCVPNPTILTSASPDSFTMLQYADGTSAGVAKKNSYVIVGFPIESIKERSKINLLIQAFASFLLK